MIFTKISKWLSRKLGHPLSFTLAVFFVLIWALLGPYYKYSDSWELVINTVTTIITFLMIFIIQNTQNRDTLSIHLKLDEMIRADKKAHNELLDVEEVSDENLEKMLKNYEELAKDIKVRMKKKPTKGKKQSRNNRFKQNRRARSNRLKNWVSFQPFKNLIIGMINNT